MPVAQAARPGIPAAQPARPPTVGPAAPPVLGAARAPAPGGPQRLPQAAPAGTRPPPAVSPGIAPLVAPLVPAVPQVAPTQPRAFAPGGFAPPPPSTPDTTLEGDALLTLDARYEALDRSDYFQVLQIPNSASPGEIKKAFYRESRALHPDRFYHLPDKALKERVNELYKRITEAYYFLRDDVKRPKYLADVTGPEREKKLRFTEATESEVKAQQKKQNEEAIGLHPKARTFYQTAMQDMDAERWSAAERNLKMALTYEPSNARYKEKLAEVQAKIDAGRDKGDAFKIK